LSQKENYIIIISTNEEECPEDKKHRPSKDVIKRELMDAYDSLTPTDMGGKKKVNRYYEHKYDIIKFIEDVIEKTKPNTILIPNPSYNQDHQTVYEACMVALRPHDINHYVPIVLMYEVYDYTNWGENQMEMNYFKEVDIKAKIRAYRKMKSQVRSYRSPTDLKRWAETVGKKCKLKYAEGFRVLRWTEY